MKSERRHELQHNELADWLTNTFEAMKPHQNAILAVVAVAVLAVAVWSWWSRTSASQNALAWDEVNVGLTVAASGGSLDRLSMVVDQYPGTPACNAATLIMADLRLMGGCSQRFVNKASAEQELSKAIGLYETVLRKTKTSSLLERATFGLARAKEAKGELSEAVPQYERLVKEWPNGAYTALAKQRIEDLGRPETKRMFDDFAKFDPKPKFSREPGSTTELPGLDESVLPTEPKKTPAAKGEKLEGSKATGGKPVVKDSKPAAKPAAKDAKPAGGKKK